MLYGISLPNASNQLLIQLIALIALFFIIKSLLSAVLLRATSLVLARNEAEITDEISRYLFQQTLSDLKAFNRGDIQFVITQSSHFAVNRLLSAGAAAITDGALFLLIIAVFFFVDSIAAFVVTTYFLVLVGIFQFVINRRLHNIGEDLAETNIRSLNIVQNLLTAFRELVTLSRRDFFLSKLSAERKQHALAFAQQLFFLGLPRYFIESALMLGVLGLIAWQFSRGDFTEGLAIVAVFLAGGVRMMGALLPLQNAISTLRTVGPQAELALDILEMSRKNPISRFQEISPKRSSRLAHRAHSNQGAEIIVQNVSFTYFDASDPVIKNVSLMIPGGSHVALIGPSGGGKTTIVDLMLGVNIPQSGVVLIDGQSPQIIREAFPGIVAYVPQTPGMVSGPIRENVALGVAPEDIDDEKVWDVLRQAQLVEYVQKLPAGLYTNLGEHADGLSGGQKQRIGLARALYGRPRVLILDEATSALDAETEAAISNTIRSLGEAVTVVVVAHRLSTIQTSDHVFIIEEGTVTDEGPFSVLRFRVPMIEEYLRLVNLD